MISLSQVSKTIWSARVLLVLSLVVGAGGGLALDQLSGPAYSSSAYVEIRDQNIIGVVLGVGGQANDDPERVTRNAGAFAKSPDVLKRLAQQLGQPEDTWRDLDLQLTVTPQSGWNALEIRAEATDPDTAIRVANGAATNFTNQYREYIIPRTTASQLAPSPRATDQVNVAQRLQVVQVLSPPARVVSLAAQSDQIRPAPVRNALAGGVLFLILAVVAVWARAALSKRIYSVEEIRKEVGVPVVPCASSRTGGGRLSGALELFQRMNSSAPKVAVSSMRGASSATFVHAVAAELSTHGEIAVAVDLHNKSPQYQEGRGANGANKWSGNSGGVDTDVVAPNSVRWTLVSIPSIETSAQAQAVASAYDDFYILLDADTTSRKDVDLLRERIAEWNVRPGALIWLESQTSDSLHRAKSS